MIFLLWQYYVYWQLYFFLLSDVVFQNYNHYQKLLENVMETTFWKLFENMTIFYTWSTKPHYRISWHEKYWWDSSQVIADQYSFYYLRILKVTKMVLHLGRLYFSSYTNCMMHLKTAFNACWTWKVFLRQKLSSSNSRCNRAHQVQGSALNS